ncbi:MAG: precorrin-6y C5,15-methyltransferase (decarboxylating) subunit CbiE [Solirubrobacterales bacterium]
MLEKPLVIAGIGADGWQGLGQEARDALLTADQVIGSHRQLALLPELGAELRPWPSPIGPLVDELAAGSEAAICVLASGDPMLHGIGATLSRRMPPDALVVYPHASAFTLACAALRWPAAEVELVSAVSVPSEIITPLLQPARRLIVYVSGERGAADVARVLVDHGCGPSRFVVQQQLGSDQEAIIESTAAEWGEQGANAPHLVAIECRAAAGSALNQRSPGLPDAAFENDGQLTKQLVRAATLAALAPTPRSLLWDIGAGSGSIAIEWMRTEPTSSAIAIEPREDRAERIELNAKHLGALGLQVLPAKAPEALEHLSLPDAIFIGGGVTQPGMIDDCWNALLPGGRLVANAVTLEGERVLADALEQYGGRMARIDISHAEPIGGFTGWRAQMPVVQWVVRKDLA